ncbi:MAG: rhomboid family intramembrane serine protease [Acidimicrobiales bacterium]|nr:rhomboid family intramembrane serine protease [Acidimicrobiales bacterium]HRW37806.1 rhomboid family intramembrane serine protease [Aquihabitans sp.]
MSGRYAFSLPDPRQRDGWFRIGTVDVTTTALIVGVGALSMVLYAISPDIPYWGVFATSLVRDGEVWRLVTWPLVGYPSLWELIGLAVFWYFGHQVEDRIGRKPYTWLVLAMTVLPALVVTAIGAGNDSFDRWDAATAGVSLLSLAFLTVFALENPGARTMFFGIPFWIVAAAFVGIAVLSAVGARAWGTLWLMLLVIAVGCLGARQRGMLGDVLGFVPVVPWLAGPPPSPYGEIGSARPRARKRGRTKGTGTGPSVVQGPWGAPTSGPTPLEQAELDVLLDRISEGGLDSLSKQERTRLEELSRRFRDS